MTKIPFQLWLHFHGVKDGNQCSWHRSCILRTKSFFVEGDAIISEKPLCYSALILQKKLLADNRFLKSDMDLKSLAPANFPEENSTLLMKYPGSVRVFLFPYFRNAIIHFSDDKGFKEKLFEEPS